MTTLRILLAHADSDPVLLAQYRHALEGVDADLTAFVAPPVPGVPGGGLSSRYELLAQTLRRDGRILPGLQARYPSPRPAELLVLVTFSSAFKLAQRLFETPADFDAIHAWVALDSLHTGLDRDGTASDQNLVPFLAFAREAMAGRKLCWIGHSDVQTPQHGPGAYASTTQTADELLRLLSLGGSTPQEDGSILRCQQGLLRVQSYNVRDAMHQREEHGQALWGWGPRFVGAAMRDLVTSLGRETLEPSPPPWRDPHLTLGERCVLWSLEESRLVREDPPGSNDGERIREYFAPAYRYETGKLLVELGITHGNWCAVSACAAARACAFGGETIPHPYCASGIELERAAKTQPRSAWRTVEQVLSGEWTPRVGDLVLLDRDDPKVRGDEWQRHVTRISVWRGDGSYRAVGGNEGQCWRETERHVRDADVSGPRRAIKGFIEYPR